jgi:DNA-binding transcriptional ArsR family regulator
VFVSAASQNWEAIAAFYDAGHSVAECRRHFGFSGRAWAAAVERRDVEPRHGRNGRPPGKTRVAVQRLIDEGLSFAEIARKLGVAKPTVSYHARKLGIPPFEAASRRYEWDEVQRFYADGHSIRECCRHFGFSTNAWYQAVERGVVQPRERVEALTRYLVMGRQVNRFHLKNHLFNAGLKENRCEICGISEWRGAPLTMALHHVNGDGRDNRLENLRILCPNCHGQTENFAGRNVRRNGNGNGSGAGEAL